MLCRVLRPERSRLVKPLRWQRNTVITFKPRVKEALFEVVG